MKFIHLSDLHLGKKVSGFSMIDEQKYILEKILEMIPEIQPDGIIIAGDVFDTGVAQVEAIRLFEQFLENLWKIHIPVFVISGNHDSADRLSYCSKFITDKGIYISKSLSGDIEPITLKDEYGEVNIYLLPFIKPVDVRNVYQEEFENYTDAVKYVIDRMNVDTSKRNVLVAHQFVGNAKLSKSETSINFREPDNDKEVYNVGGIDNVEKYVFDVFDYTALGHIHQPQNVGSPSVRYCGTPLKYSLEEIDKQKSLTVVELNEKGTLKIDEIPLKPKNDMRQISGKYEDLVSKENYEGTAVNDYIYAVLTDDDYIPDVVQKLRTIYPNIMSAVYDNARTSQNNSADVYKKYESKTPLEFFGELFQRQNNENLTDEDKKILENLISEIWEVEE
ncbi:MAG: exonuclease SbcCD subunit D [Clostridia bacterium]|nr:exonuclease SbcCD subunit D [Clostridia bacterium]